MEIFNVEINLVAIVLASIANMIIGMLWYSDIFVGKQWLLLINKKREELKMSGADIPASIVSAILIAAGLNSILQYSLELSGLNVWINAIVASIMVTFTLVGTGMYNSVLYEGKSLKLFFLNISHKFVEILIMSLIISIFIQ